MAEHLKEERFVKFKAASAGVVVVVVVDRYRHLLIADC